jgi:hypothetical protein
MNSSEDDVLRFIAASFPSVWALEMLLALKSERRDWSREELVASLRASELVVTKTLEALVAAGLATIDGKGAAYAPVNQDVDSAVDQAEQLYRSRPNKVRRVIVAASMSSASAFADAFKIRRGADD